MVSRISNSFALVRASADVLRLDKKLLVFPLMSGVATVLVCASFIAPILLIGPQTLAESAAPGYTAYALGFLFYLVQYSVIFFFNAALVGAALIRLDGGVPTVGHGLAIASRRMPAILGYAAIAATVGMVLRFVAERAGFVGRIATAFFGMAWTLTTYLTVPVLVTKDIGPIDAIKESAAIFKRTWGEQVVGNFGMGAAIFLMAVSWTILSFVLLSVSGSFGSFGLALPAIGVAVLGYVLLGLLSSALSGIYTAALYRYAMTGDAGSFDAGIVDNAFRPKK